MRKTIIINLIGILIVMSLFIIKFGIADAHAATYGYGYKHKGESGRVNICLSYGGNKHCPFVHKMKRSGQTWESLFCGNAVANYSGAGDYLYKKMDLEDHPDLTNYKAAKVRALYNNSFIQIGYANAQSQFLAWCSTDSGCKKNYNKVKNVSSQRNVNVAAVQRAIWKYTNGKNFKISGGSKNERTAVEYMSLYYESLPGESKNISSISITRKSGYASSDGKWQVSYQLGGTNLYGFSVSNLKAKNGDTEKNIDVKYTLSGNVLTVTAVSEKASCNYDLQLSFTVNAKQNDNGPYYFKHAARQPAIGKTEPVPIAVTRNYNETITADCKSLTCDTDKNIDLTCVTTKDVVNSCDTDVNVVNGGEESSVTKSYPNVEKSYLKEMFEATIKDYYKKSVEECGKTSPYCDNDSCCKITVKLGNFNLEFSEKRLKEKGKLYKLVSEKYLNINNIPESERQYYIYLLNGSALSKLTVTRECYTTKNSCDSVETNATKIKEYVPVLKIKVKKKYDAEYKNSETLTKSNTKNEVNKSGDYCTYTSTYEYSIPDSTEIELNENDVDCGKINVDVCDSNGENCNDIDEDKACPIDDSVKNKCNPYPLTCISDGVKISECETNGQQVVYKYDDNGCPYDCECGAKSSAASFYFRAVDNNDVFPNERKITGNWKKYTNGTSNEVLYCSDNKCEIKNQEDLYKEPEYSVTLNASDMNKIKDYNNGSATSKGNSGSAGTLVNSNYKSEFLKTYFNDIYSDIGEKVSDK